MDLPRTAVGVLLLRFFLASAGVLTILLIPSCDELLPPRSDPSKALRIQASFIYTYVEENNTVQLMLEVFNTYDETIEDTLVAEGAIVLTHRGPDSSRSTIPVDWSYRWSGGNVNPGTNVLRLDAGRSIRFKIPWNMRDDRNVSLLEDVFTYYQDPDCRYRLLSYRQVFDVSGSFQLFRRVPRTLLDAGTLSLCYAYPIVAKDVCPLPSLTSCLDRP